MSRSHSHSFVHLDGPFKGYSNLQLLYKLTVARPDLTAAVTSLPLPPLARWPRVNHRILPSLGILDYLSNQLIQEIFLHVDLCTLVWSCRSLNSHAQALVDTLLPFRRLCEYADQMVSALLATNAASYFSVGHLYALLVSRPSCWLCGEFGGFLYMPLGVRCCMFCLLTRKEFMPMTRGAAMNMYYLTEDDFRDWRLPVVRPVNGMYGVDKPMPVTRNYVQILVSQVRVREIVEPFLPRTLLENGDKQFEEKVTGSLTPKKKKKKKGSSPDGFEDPRMMVAARHLWRLQCAAPFPFLQVIMSSSMPSVSLRGGGGKSSNVLVKVQRGISCAGCRNVSGFWRGQPEDLSVEQKLWGVKLDVRMFTEEGFLEHVQTCAAASEYWGMLMEGDAWRVRPSSF